jgi:phage terminase large subunit GpA-like protein
VKGSNKADAPIVSSVRRNNRYKAATMSVGTDQAKTLIYSRLKLTEPGLGYCHFPDVTQGYDPQFYSELTAEELRISFKRGFAVREWHKAEGRRNEALDVRVYALAVLRWLNPDWVKVAAKAKKSEAPPVPVNPAEPGTIAPDAGPAESQTLRLVKARPRPPRATFPTRSFTRNWARY